MFFDDPRNALSVARTHQRALVEKEHHDRLARQARAAESDPRRPGLTQWWQIMRRVGWWLLARVAGRGALRGKPQHLSE
jgi:hypothetical protein